MPLKSRCSRKWVEPKSPGVQGAALAGLAGCSSREPTATQKPMVRLRLPGTCSLRMRTPLGKTLRRTRDIAGGLKREFGQVQGKINCTVHQLPPYASAPTGGPESAGQSAADGGRIRAESGQDAPGFRAVTPGAPRAV